MEEIEFYNGVGHGGTDPGACSNGRQEKDLTLRVATAMHNFLKQNGINSHMSRTSDVSMSLSEKSNEANEMNADLGIDIHFNAGGGDGSEAYYSIAGGTGKTFAERAIARLEEIGQNTRGAKTKVGDDGEDYYHMIRETEAPFIIVECAFIDNEKDMAIADTNAELDAMGIALGKAALDVYGLDGDSTPTTPPTQSTGQKEVAPKPTLKKGSKGAEVEKLQKNLGGLTVDGDFGSKTETALKSWQWISGLTADGIYGSKSQAEMQKQIDSGSIKSGTSYVIPTPTLKKGSTGQEVKELQTILKVKVDGDFGSKTESALKDWQKKYMGSAEADGIYGSKTEAKMKEVY